MVQRALQIQFFKVRSKTVNSNEIVKKPGELAKDINLALLESFKQQGNLEIYYVKLLQFSQPTA